MATSLVNLKKDVECFLCNDSLTEPKILPCFHTFCRPCIKRHAELIEEVNVFKCPKCKSQTPLPELNSVEDLKSSVLHSRILKILEFIEGEKICSVSESHSTATQHCFDCDRSLCDECLKYHSLLMNNHKIMSLGQSESKEKIIELLLSREKNCLSHLEKTLDLYCNDCKQNICLECWMQDHDGHSTVSLGKHLSTKKAVLLKHVEQLKLQEKQIQEQVKFMNDAASKIKESCDKAKAEVTETLERTIKELEQNAQQILSKLDKEIEDAKLKEIKGQSTLEQARGAIDYASTLLEKGFTSELIGEGDDVGIYDKSFEILNFDGDDNLVVFDPSKELIKQASLGLGSIRKVDQTEQDLGLLNFLSSVKVEAKKPGHPEAAKPQQMSAKIKQFDLKGMYRFTGIAVNKENTKITFADSLNNRVFVFDMIGNLLIIFYSHFCDPQGLAFLNKEDLVIADCDNHRICIVNTTSGTVQGTIGKRGNRKTEFINPCHVHVDSNYNIIVSDLGNNRVQVFSKEWKFQYQFGQVNNIHPCGTISHNGQYYVSDSYSNVVHVFAINKSKDRGFKPVRISVINGQDSTEGVLREPCGLAIDSEENLLVCDRGNNRIQKFTLDGLSLGYLDCSGIFDVAVLKDGSVLVSCNQLGVFIIQDM
ncbi:E3 ubiquitin-protein ligase TRIM71-like [Actinia tenebrosa]|uniref:E3 ubiquitin-protein ligase TRIM71-like n=1 Tax=Actinia tenebrosa TaxID=6105 RepID=A0A6P8I0W8_ACTTE|nr:E3 ubiquitin-protein ligase TRIM71-like [Actinia tenebrosa]